MEQAITTREPRRRKSKTPNTASCTCQRCRKRKLIDFAVYIGVILLGILHVPISIVIVMVDIDVFYLITERYILPNAYMRDIVFVVISRGIRTLLTMAAGIESFRFLALLFLILLPSTVLLFISVVEKLLHCGKLCHRLHVQGRILLTSFKMFVDFTTGFCLIMAHALLVLLCWLSFKCYGKLPILIYVGLIILLIYMLAIVAIALFAAERIPSVSSGMILSRMQVNFSVGTVAKAQIIEYKIWKAEKCLGLNFGTFFPIRKGFSMVYFSHLIDNVVTSLLLI